MNQTPDDSMDDFDDDSMDESMLVEEEDDTKSVKANALVSRRRIEDLMERRRLAMQLKDDFYDLDLPDEI